MGREKQLVHVGDEEEHDVGVPCKTEVGAFDAAFVGIIICQSLRASLVDCLAPRGVERLRRHAEGSEGVDDGGDPFTTCNSSVIFGGVEAGGDDSRR